MLNSEYRATQLYKDIVNVTDNSTLAHEICLMVLDEYKTGYFDSVCGNPPKSDNLILNYTISLED